MIPRGVFPVLLLAALLASSAASAADAYRPNEFFTLDLAKAALSPKPLGPPMHFAPVAVEAKSDRGSEAALARELKTEPRQIATQEVKPAPRHVAVQKSKPAPVHVAARERSERRHGAVRAHLARRHSNPLDAQARDTRIQVWPCRSGGGICDWKRAH